MLKYRMKREREIREQTRIIANQMIFWLLVLLSVFSVQSMFR